MSRVDDLFRDLKYELNADIEMYRSCNARQAETITKKNKKIERLEAEVKTLTEQRNEALELVVEADKIIAFIFGKHTPYMLRLKAIMDEGVLDRLAVHAKILDNSPTEKYQALGADLKRLVEAVGAKCEPS